MATTNKGLGLSSPVTDGATAVGHYLDTVNALATAGALLFSWRTNGSQKAAVDYRGAMLFGDGTEALPGAAFIDDSNSGFYRIGADNVGLSLGGTKRWDFGTAGSTLTGTLTVSGAVTLQSTLAVTGIVTLSDDVKVAATKKIYPDGGGDTYLYEAIANKLAFVAGASTILELTTSGAFVSTGDLLTQAAAKVRLDGSFSGDTYTYESAANTVDHVAGGTVALQLTSTEVRINSATNPIIALQSAAVTRATIRATAASKIEFFDSGGSTMGDVTSGAWTFANADTRFNQALVALGGGAAATLGTIGGSGPTTAAQNTWKKFLDSTGASFWVPVWK